MYHSTFGVTKEGHSKPELIAPAIWIAGPILPGTDQYQESRILFDLLKASPKTFERRFVMQRKSLPAIPKKLSTVDRRKWVRDRIVEMKYVAPYYKHVDGTSFAAPMVSSVVAQMLEATPELTPAQVKQILIETAEQLSGVPVEQQGHGVPNPRAAVKHALLLRHRERSPGVHVSNGRMYFVYNSRIPRGVTLTGDFNGWNPERTFLHESEPGTWSCWIPKPPSGKYRYKFVIDGGVWLEDPANSDKEPDGFGGWNSNVVITNDQ
jgi:serine protease AprX